MKPKSALAIVVATLAGLIVYLVTAVGEADESTAAP
jgi:type III secretory pathway component EscS